MNDISVLLILINSYIFIKAILIKASVPKKQIYG